MHRSLFSKPSSSGTLKTLVTHILLTKSMLGEIQRSEHAILDICSLISAMVVYASAI